MKRLFFLLLFTSFAASAQSSSKISGESPKLAYSNITNHSITVSWPGLENKSKGTLFLSWEHSGGESGGVSIFFPEPDNSFTFNDLPAETDIHFSAFLMDGITKKEILQGITCATTSQDIGTRFEFYPNR